MAEQLPYMNLGHFADVVIPILLNLMQETDMEKLQMMLVSQEN